MKVKDRLEELEKRIRELEARPIVYPPVYFPQPYYVPVPYYPQPFTLPYYPYSVTCMQGFQGAGMGGNNLQIGYTS